MKFKLYNLLLEHPCKFISEKVLHFAIFCYLCSKLFEHAKANVRNSNTDPTPNPSPTREGRWAEPSYERGERGAAILQERGEGLSYPTREGRGAEPSYKGGENRRESRLSPLSPPFKGRGWGWGL